MEIDSTLLSTLSFSLFSFLFHLHLTKVSSTLSMERVNGIIVSMEPPNPYSPPTYDWACLKGKPYCPNFCEGSIPRHDIAEIGRIRGKGNLGKKKSESHMNNMKIALKGKKKTESHVNKLKISMKGNRNAAIDPSKRTPQQQKNYEMHQRAKKAREQRAAEEQMPAAKKHRMMHAFFKK